MGTGKTVVGKLLATRLHKQFIDIDVFIEKKTGKSISKIFEEGGETRFRETESAAIKEIAGKNGAVISCGGGSVVNPINVLRLKEKGVIVLLTASLETIRRRIAGTCTRPLFDSGDISSLLKARETVYTSAADLIVDTSELTVHEVVTAIVGEVGCT